MEGEEREERGGVREIETQREFYLMTRSTPMYVCMYVQGYLALDIIMVKRQLQ